MQGGSQRRVRARSSSRAGRLKARCPGWGRGQVQGWVQRSRGALEATVSVTQLQEAHGPRGSLRRNKVRNDQSFGNTFPWD